jgi:hypothetical protein
MAGTNGVAKGREAPKQEKQRPVHEVRLGRIKAAIWANSTEQGVRYGVTLSRIYKAQEDGEWQTSTSFGKDDLLLVAKVCELAILWVYQQGQESADVPF